MAKLLKIDAEGELHQAPVVRAFNLADKTKTAVLTGTEFEDHELWLVSSSEAELVGTLHEKEYKKLRHTRNLILSCDKTSFDYMPKSKVGTKLVGRIADFNSEQTYAYSIAADARI